MKRNTIMLALVVAVAVAFAAAPAQAEQADYKFKIFGGAAYVSPLSDSDVTVDDVTSSVEASAEVGWEIGAEWKPFNRIGFEVAYLDATHDVEAGGEKIGEIGLNPFFLTANFHVINGKHVDWYVGPTVSFVDWGALDPTDPAEGDVEIDSETTYGISTGIDIGITKNFAIVGGLRWIDSTAEAADGDGEVAVDPLFARLGVAFRF